MSHVEQPQVSTAPPRRKRRLLWNGAGLLIALIAIQMLTMTVCATRNVGVPKNRANPSAFTPNQPLPNGDMRWS